MDGFVSSEGVIVLGATNQVDETLRPLENYCSYRPFFQIAISGQN